MRGHLLKIKFSKLPFDLLIAICFVIMTIVNAPALTKEVQRIYNFKKTNAHQLIGYQFYGVGQFLDDVQIMGYYTDLNIDKDDEDEGARLFAQAQYILAPVILDPNNLNHDYILFVCSEEKVAWLKMKEINAQPLRRNKFGMILAKRIR